MNPNVVCVSIDSLRADYVSFINHREETTPFLSSLGSESTVYESAISPSIWTLPVHTSVFTGLFPPEHGIETGEEVLGKHPTFAEQLRSAGYTTRAFYDNAWLDTSDILRGFNKDSTDTQTSSEESLKSKIGDRLEMVSPALLDTAKTAYRAQRSLLDTVGTAKHTTNIYRKWRRMEPQEDIKDTKGQAKISQALSEIGDIKRPFCWFLHFEDAHWKYGPPSPYHNMFTDRSTAGLVNNYVRWQEKVYGTREGRLKTITGEIEPPTDEVDTFRNLYRGCIKYCDHLINQLVDGFKEAGVWDETIFILFGDHGDSFGENGVYGHHFSTDESLIHVPLLIRDPTGAVSPGRVSEPVSLTDIYPTVLKLADVNPPDCSGVDLSDETRVESYTYYNISNHDYYTNASDHSVSQKDLPPATQQVIWRSDSERVTYYPNEDEYDEVGSDSEELRERLHKHTENLSTIDSGDREMNSAVEERLEEMGYLA